MKKRLIILLLVCTMTLCGIENVNASTNTRQRSESNYLISDNITVTDENKENILNTPSVIAEEKVYDFADLFTDEEEQQLYQKITDYINKYNMDLAVVTINTNNKKSPREYADDFYDYNDFGINNTKDGILFLIDMDNRQIYMSTTGYAIKMYNDNRIDSSLDKVYQYMSDNNYYQGVASYIDVISEYAESGLPSDEDNQMTTGEMLLYSSGISLIITFIIMYVLINKNKLARKATTAKQYLDKNDMIINNMGDMLIHTHTDRTKIEHDSSSGGGSSTHTGSSGQSHGGGGHSF